MAGNPARAPRPAPRAGSSRSSGTQRGTLAASSPTGAAFKPPAAPPPIASGSPAEEQRRRPMASSRRPTVRPVSWASSQWPLRRKQRRRGKREGVRSEAPPSPALGGFWERAPVPGCGGGGLRGACGGCVAAGTASPWSGCVGVRVGVRPASVGWCRWASLVQAGARRVPGARGARPCDPFWSLDPPGPSR